MPARILTVLRQYCPVCGRATVSKPCPYCWGGPLVQTCAECGQHPGCDGPGDGDD